MRDGCRDHGRHGACARCGTFVCDACMRWIAERAHCDDCYRRLGARPSAQASLALFVATIGFAGFVPGIAALPLARRELLRIRAGESSPAGAGMAELAHALGWFHVAASALAVIALLVRFG